MKTKLTLFFFLLIIFNAVSISCEDKITESPTQINGVFINSVRKKIDLIRQAYFVLTDSKFMKMYMGSDDANIDNVLRIDSLMRNISLFIKNVEIIAELAELRSKLCSTKSTKYVDMIEVEYFNKVKMSYISNDKLYKICYDLLSQLAKTDETIVKYKKLLNKTWIEIKEVYKGFENNIKFVEGKLNQDFNSISFSPETSELICLKNSLDSILFEAYSAWSQGVFMSMSLKKGVELDKVKSVARYYYAIKDILIEMQLLVLFYSVYEHTDKNEIKVYCKKKIKDHSGNICAIYIEYESLLDEDAAYIGNEKKRILLMFEYLKNIINFIQKRKSGDTHH